MLSKLLLFSLLLNWSVNADLSQSNQGGSPYYKPVNNNDESQNNQGGSPYYKPVNNNDESQNNQGGSPYYKPVNNDQSQGLGQGYNNQNTASPGLGQGYNDNKQGYSGLGQGSTNNGYQGSGYNGLGQPQPNAQTDLVRAATHAVLEERRQRQQSGSYDVTTGLDSRPLNQRRKRQLGQGMQPQGLGQGAPSNGGLGQDTQPQGLGQGTQNQGLGQGTQNQGLGQGSEPGLSNGGGLSGSLRLKRYAERDSYQRSCNTYYGKYICYRLYDRDASIPNDFTCWQTYVGKKNCTETENVLYLDRRNVEVDPNEQLDRQFYSNDNDRRVPSSPDSSRRDRYRQRDDEFGAIEKNLHNQRQSERRLPHDDNYRRTP